ncbi:insulin-like growth factor-binding protein-related protein 1 [Lineus longissimus]|uniref:insulin-like growth factor-binding protein-related protein 1 n=1 Tax=Lineus longissimus TaxID=88925 RepID=UPI002B4DC18C
MARLINLVISFALLLVVAGQRKSVVPTECSECHRDLCKKPQNCHAGVTKDRCSCCYICAQEEGQACDLNTGYKYGSCGDMLKCLARDDVDASLHLATCQCREPGIVCGTNDVTYNSYCQLLADGKKKTIDIGRKFKHPCKTVPSIRSPPTNVKNETGADVFLSCEATGYPIPSMSWTWVNAEQETVDLPTDDLHVSVNSRGGPDKYMVTGWMQIMDLKEHHQGDYVCKVQNEMGFATAVARVNVIDTRSRL